MNEQITERSIGMYYDDFYDEPSDFERQINEFKAGLMRAVKEEYQSELRQLRAENAELSDVKKRIVEFEQERCYERLEVERIKREALAEAKKLRLSQLLPDDAIKYRAETLSEQPPKCDKCNDKRKIPFISPLGRSMEEDCECALFARRYIPKPSCVVQIYSNRRGLEMYYRKYESYFGDMDSEQYDIDPTHAETIWKQGDPWPENSYRAFFDNESDCQAYCNWLNSGKKPTASKGE